MRNHDPAPSGGERVPVDRRYQSDLRAFRRSAALVAIAILILGSCFFARLGGAHFLRNLSNVALFCAAFAAAIGCISKARRTSGRVRASWALLGAATASWGIGQCVWTWYESVLGDAVPFPSLADVGYLGMPFFTVVGLLVLGTASQTAANRARSVLDGLMIATSLLLISWVVVLGPTIDAGSDSLFTLTISLAYPVSDVVMVTIVFFILAGRRQFQVDTTPLILVGCGLATFAVSDSGFTYPRPSRTHTTPAARRTWAGSAGSCSSCSQPCFPNASRPMRCRRPARRRRSVFSCPTWLWWPQWQRRSSTSCVAESDRHRFVGQIPAHHADGRTSDPHHAREPGPHARAGLEARVAEQTQELTASEQRFRALVQHSSDVVIVVDADSTVMYQSESIERVFGHREDSVAGRPLTDIFSGDAAMKLLETLKSACLRAYGVATIELPLARPDGRICQAEISVTNLLEDENVRALVLNMRDVTERRQLEDQLVHEAFHDTLTGLADGLLLSDRVGQALQRRSSSEFRIAVLFLDLDGFKEQTTAKAMLPATPSSSRSPRAWSAPSVAKTRSRVSVVTSSSSSFARSTMTKCTTLETLPVGFDAAFVRRSRSTVSRSTSAPASASPMPTRAPRMSGNSSGTPTSRCTGRRPRARVAMSSTARRCTPLSSTSFRSPQT